MGLALESTGTFVEAIASFERAVSIEPEFADPYYALSRLYRRTGDKEGMKRALETFRMLKAKEKGNLSGMGGSRSLTNP
jgi:Flp pilus assembly protein TadD